MYQTHKMGDFLKHRSEFFTIDDFQEYKRVRVQLHGRGIIQRDSITGSQVKTKKQQAAKAGEFLVAEIDAKVGGFGIVPPELDGAIVSSHYFLFEIDESVCLKEWLDYFVRGGLLTEQVTARGSTNYAAIRPHHVLDFEVPLPSLPEQRRIVGRIEELAGKVEEARRLRVAAADETATLFGAKLEEEFSQLDHEYGSEPVGTVISFRNDLIRPTDGKTGSLRFVGLQHVESHTGKKLGEDWLEAETLTGRKFIFSSGEIVYGYLRPYLNKVWIADCEGVCSVDQYVIRPNAKRINREYLAYFMRSPIFLRQAIELTHNLMLPRLRTALLESIPVPLPPLSLQERYVLSFQELEGKTETLKQHQKKVQQELDALLPSMLDKAFKGVL